MAEMPSSEQVDAGEDVPKKSRNLELFAAILLGLASMLTAYAAYRGSIVSDGVLQNYSAASQQQADGNDSFGMSDSLSTIEQSLFVEWAVLTTEENTVGADYVLALMDPVQQELVVRWFDDDNSPISPFVEPFYDQWYDLPSTQASAAGEEALVRAAEFQSKAQKADDKGDVFELSTVFLAVTLFLAGVATLLDTRKIQRVVLLLSSAMLVVGTIVLIQAEMT